MSLAKLISNEAPLWQKIPSDTIGVNDVIMMYICMIPSSFLKYFSLNLFLI